MSEQDALIVAQQQRIIQQQQLLDDAAKHLKEWRKYSTSLLPRVRLLNEAEYREFALYGSGPRSYAIRFELFFDVSTCNLHVDFGTPLRTKVTTLTISTSASFTRLRISTGVKLHSVVALPGRVEVKQNGHSASIAQYPSDYELGFQDKLMAFLCDIQELEHNFEIINS